MHQQFMETIGEIDTVLDSLSGSKAAGKRKVTNDLVEKNEAAWKEAVDGTIAYLDAQPIEIQAAVVNAFKSKLDEKYGKEVTGYIEGLVDQQPVQQPLATEEEGEKLSKQRSELYQRVKAIVELNESVGGDPLDMPKMRRGSSGKRGPRNLSLFVFEIDGEEVDMTVGQIAKNNGYEKASELTEALREFGFDTREGSEFDNFELPNGKKLSGVRQDDEDEEKEPEEAPEENS